MSTADVHVFATLRTKGILNLPGITVSSTKCAEELLRRDAETHHCFFNTANFHNHLSHHVLAAYDLGAPAGLLRKIYDLETEVQRPILPDGKDPGISVDLDNWKQYTRNPSAYAALVKFFSKYIEQHGISNALVRFIFDNEALQVHMLGRLMHGLVHPLIQIAYGLEFGIDAIVATGLAQTVIAEDDVDIIQPAHNLELSFIADSNQITVLEIMRRIYDSPVFGRDAYDPHVKLYPGQISASSGARRVELEKLVTAFVRSTHLEDLEARLFEFTWASTLLLFGATKRGEPTRLDFFNMHLVTSSLFLKSYMNALTQECHKRSFLYAYTMIFILTWMYRGRQRIDANAIMDETEIPRPPLREHLVKDEDYNPWGALITSALHAPESHVKKTIRTLVYGAMHLGRTEPGKVLGAWMKGEDETDVETFPGLARVDGTLFARSAGVMMNYVGWVDHGQEYRDWDRSVLEWNEGWE